MVLEGDDEELKWEKCGGRGNVVNGVGWWTNMPMPPKYMRTLFILHTHMYNALPLFEFIILRLQPTNCQKIEIGRTAAAKGDLFDCLVLTLLEQRLTAHGRAIRSTNFTATVLLLHCIAVLNAP